MGLTLHDLIPGLREAEDAYRSEAQEAFAGVEPKIAGAVEILPLTPRMLLDLDGAENGFVVGAKADEGITCGDIGVFLWRCSPYYERGNDDLRRFFQANLAPLEYETVVRDVSQYLRRSMAGMPLWKGHAGGARGVTTWASRLVHMFAKEYGWSEAQVLDLPFRRLWQYANRILEGADPKYVERAPEALRLRAQWLHSRNAARAARN